MNSIDVLRRILEMPTSEVLESALDGEDVGQEIFDIAQFDDRQVLDFTGTIGPSQFKTIMVACRLVPRDLLVSFVVECALHVLPIAQAAYPKEKVLSEFAAIKNLPASLARRKMTSMLDRIDQLYLRSNADEEASRNGKFDQLGYVPLEWGRENGRASSAICVLSMATAIVRNQDSPRLARNNDGMMCALIRVFPDATEELGKWMVAKLSQLVEEHLLQA